MENLRAMSHFKDQLQTTLQYARNLANTVCESIKRVVPWAADYIYSDSSDQRDNINFVWKIVEVSIYLKGFCRKKETRVDARDHL